MRGFLWESVLELKKIFGNQKVADAIEMAVNCGELDIADFGVRSPSTDVGDTSTFLAIIQRMNGIQRWNKSQSIKPEFLHEHSYSVAMICYFIGLHRERIHGGDSDFSAEKLAILGLFHDIGESLSEDFNGLLKHNDPIVSGLVRSVEHKMLRKLSTTVDDGIRDRLGEYIIQDGQSEVYRDLVKAGDEISAYMKTEQELRSNNGDFVRANRDIRKKICLYFNKYPEVEYVFNEYTPAFSLTIDELAEMLPLSE